MATAVLDLDLADPPKSLSGLARFDSALVLLRLHKRPVGQAVLALAEDEIQADDLRARLLKAADSSFWEAWLKSHLGLDDSEPGGRPLAATTTVAICTRDRTDDLRRCLMAISAMPDDGQQVLVIDNAPSDDSTQALVAEFPHVRYVREPRPGLDIARNRALSEATTDIVAFTDDDAAADPLWLRTLVRNFEDPMVMASTGLTMALELETEAQVRFQRYGGFVRGFKRVVYEASQHDPTLGWHAGAGVNMAMRRSVVDLIGPFDEALDAGTPTRAGGDSEMFQRILLAGYHIVYDPEAIAWHRHRRSEQELLSQLIGYELSGGAVLSRAFFVSGHLGSAGRYLHETRRHFQKAIRGLIKAAGSESSKLDVARLRAFLAGPWVYLQARRKIMRA